jgi:ABC-three component (ABC-3C) system Middle Component 2
MIPEDDPVFRQARLILLLAAAGDGLDLERLGCYDFLAEHPLLLARDEADPDRLPLLLAGFDDRAISYASAPHRFVSRQLSLPRDIESLVARGLVEVSMDGRIRYRLTDAGRTLAGQFTARYSQAYTTAARIVLRRVRRLSGRKLRENMRDWLTVAHPDRLGGRLDPAHVIDLDPTPEWRSGFPEDET